MDKIIEIRRVTVIAESAMQDALVTRFLQMGVKGFSTTDISGAGKHDMQQDPLTGKTHVQLTIIAPPPLAEAVLKHVHEMRKNKHKVIAYLEPVWVYENDGFF